MIILCREIKMSRFYVCKHCRKKVLISYIAQHTVRNHIDKNYYVVDYDSQTTFEIENNQLTGKVQIKDTLEDMEKKYGFQL